jgi:hypothetical protein
VDQLSRDAEVIFQRFRVLPGARHIASPYAIEGLLRLIDQQRPRRILEIGAGIGTLTSVIGGAARAGAEVITVEDVPYCQEQLAVNLGDLLALIELRDSLDELSGVFDLVVVDGHQLINVLRYVSPGGYVFVEGDRWEQRDALATTNRPYCVAHYRSLRLRARDDPWSVPERYHSGYWIYAFEPSLDTHARFVAADLWYNRAIATRRRARRLAGIERRQKSRVPAGS